MAFLYSSTGVALRLAIGGYFHAINGLKLRKTINYTLNNKPELFILLDF